MNGLQDMARDSESRGLTERARSRSSRRRELDLLASLEIYQWHMAELWKIEQHAMASVRGFQVGQGT